MEVDKVLKVLEERLSPEIFKDFQSRHKKYIKAPQYENNEFGFLKSIRRFFMRKFESTSELSFLEAGLSIFESLFKESAVDSSYILIHTAYFYEYFKQSKKADECIENALANPTLNLEFIIEKVGGFYCHLAEKQFSNPEKRASLVYETLINKDSQYKESVEQQFKKINANQFYGRFKNITGNNADQLVSKILKDKEILSKLKDMLSEMKSLVETSQITIDSKFLDGMVRKAIKTAGTKFREQSELDLSNECTLLDIKCSDIFIVLRGDNDSCNFSNYCDVADILGSAKRQYLHLKSDAKEYYEQYDTYLEKAIKLGEDAINNIKPQDSDGPRFYSSLANAYRLRGNRKKGKKSASEDYKRSVELFKALGDVIYINKTYLDWSVERLAECYFRLCDYQSAIKEYEILFKESSSKKFHAALGLGHVYDAMKDFLSAKTWYLEALKISKDTPAAYDNVIHLHRNYGYYDEAIYWQRKMICLDYLQPLKKTMDYQYFRLATLYEEKGDIEKAIEIFRDIVTKRQPDSHVSLDHLISLLITKENYYEAIIWLKTKIDMSSSPLWDYCRLGDCYLYSDNISVRLRTV